MDLLERSRPVVALVSFSPPRRSDGDCALTSQSTAGSNRRKSEQTTPKLKGVRKMPRDGVLTTDASIAKPHRARCQSRRAPRPSETALSISDAIERNRSELERRPKVTGVSAAEDAATSAATAREDMLIARLIATRAAVLAEVEAKIRLLAERLCENTPQEDRCLGDRQDIALAESAAADLRALLSSAALVGPDRVRKTSRNTGVRRT